MSAHGVNKMSFRWVTKLQEAASGPGHQACIEIKDCALDEQLDEFRGYLSYGGADGDL